MGTKRPFNEDIHPSRRQNVQSSIPRATKRARPNPSERASQHPHNLSLNRLKGKIRDLTRMLGRSERLPADVRVEKERALAGYRLDLSMAQEEKRKKDLIGKYHMVRFFERQKATRSLKKLQTRASTHSPTSSNHVSLHHAIHEAEVDLNYTIYYPLLEKYHSLYPRAPNLGSDHAKDYKETIINEKRETGDQKPPLWKLVEQSMSDGTLEELRDRKVGTKGATAKARSVTNHDMVHMSRHMDGGISTNCDKGSKGGGGGEGRPRVKEGTTVDEEMSDDSFFEK